MLNRSEGRVSLSVSFSLGKNTPGSGHDIPQEQGKDQEELVHWFQLEQQIEGNVTHKKATAFSPAKLRAVFFKPQKLQVMGEFEKQKNDL